MSRNPQGTFQGNRGGALTHLGLWKDFRKKVEVNEA